MHGYESIYLLLNWFVNLDLAVQAWAQNTQSYYLAVVFNLITYLGSSVAYPILSAIITYRLLDSYKRWEGIFLNVSLCSAWVLMDFLKELFERTRPTGEALTIASGYSMPSGHAMLSMAFYGFLAVLLLRQRNRPYSWWAAGLLLLVLLIGFSRIYLNVHYLSDVLAGFILGFICLRLSLAGMDRLKQD